MDQPKEDAVPEPGTIDVGAANSDGSLRLWKARTAVAQGELLLGAHQNSIGRVTTSASSLLGWSVTIALALGAAIPTLIPGTGTQTANQQFLSKLLWPAVASFGCILIAAIFCVSVLWPSYWRAAAVGSEAIRKDTSDTELQVLEAVALGYELGIAENDAKLRSLQTRLRAAWLLFPAAPAVGVLVYLRLVIWPG
jgi:hypothetical protein